MRQFKAIHDPISIFENGKSFVSECSRVLNTTTAGTAIYILSCSYPEDFTAILELLRFDLSQPHRHPVLSGKRPSIELRSTAIMISSLQKCFHILPANEYNRLWLEVVEQWLLTCPIDVEHYKPDENRKDVFCQKLRGDLLDSILNIS